MECCITTHSSILTPQNSLSLNNKSNNTCLIKTPRFHYNPDTFSHFPGVLGLNSKTRRTTLLLRGAFDETWGQSSSTTEQNKVEGEGGGRGGGGGGDGVVDNDVRLDIVTPVNVNESETKSIEEVKVMDDNDESSSSEDVTLLPLNEFFDNFNIQLDIEDTPTILLYGGSSLLAVWLLSAIIGAIDSIPVFPKLLEVVGLGYSVWFTTRYLLFKKNREELGSKIEELKQEVFGSGDK